MQAFETQISLNYPFLYQWKKQSDVSVISNEISSVDFEQLSGCNKSNAGEILKKLPFNFALVVDSADYLLAAVDKVRSFPILYKLTESELTITDDIQGIEKDIVINEHVASEFINDFFCKDDSTLAEGWKQLPPGSFLLFDKNSNRLSVERYFSFVPQLPYRALHFEEARQIYLRSFERTIRSLNGRPVILPLTGGYDSRCILAVLLELGVKNLFAFTYGSATSPERETAAQAASQLRLNWKFVEYTDQLLDNFFSEQWSDYSGKNHHFTSLPQEQDFFAMQYLSQNKLIPPDGAVFIGHMGDWLGGSMYKKDFEITDMDKFQDEYIAGYGSKYIINGVREFEYFGHEWRMPLMAPEIIDYWFSISLDDRCFGNGYNDFMMEAFFKPLRIDIMKPGHHFKPNPGKGLIKKYLPDKVISTLKKIQLKGYFADPNNLNYLTKKLAETENLPIPEDGNFNVIHAGYFIKKLSESLMAKI